MLFVCFVVQLFSFHHEEREEHEENTEIIQSPICAIHPICGSIFLSPDSADRADDNPGPLSSFAFRLLRAHRVLRGSTLPLRPSDRTHSGSDDKKRTAFPLAANGSPLAEIAAIAVAIELAFFFLLRCCGLGTIPRATSAIRPSDRTGLYEHTVPHFQELAWR
jgi:hypothetical protein